MSKWVAYLVEDEDQADVINLGSKDDKSSAIELCIRGLFDRDEFERDDEEDECREALNNRGYWVCPYVATNVYIEEIEEDEPTTFI